MATWAYTKYPSLILEPRKSESDVSRSKYSSSRKILKRCLIILELVPKNAFETQAYQKETETLGSFQHSRNFLLIFKKILDEHFGPNSFEVLEPNFLEGQRYILS